MFRCAHQSLCTFGKVTYVRSCTMNVITCILMLYLLSTVFAERRLLALRGMPLLLFQNSTLDNNKTEWTLYVNGEKNSHLATWKVTSEVEYVFKNENIYMDKYRNIWIRKVCQNDEGKYTIKYILKDISKLDHTTGPEVHLSLVEELIQKELKVSRDDFQEVTEKDYDRSTSERDPMITAILVILVIIGGFIIAMIVYKVAWIQCKKSKGVPEQVHVTSHHDSLDSTSYLLMWDKPDDGGSPLLKYILRYQEVKINPDRTNYELSRPFSEFSSVDNIPPSAVDYRLAPLMPGRYYNIEIKAVNTQGQSTSQNFIFKTKEGVPQPVQVTSHRDSPHSTSYLLTWNKPDDEGSLPEKYILKYRNVEIMPGRTEYELSEPLNEYFDVNNILPSDVCSRLEPLMGGRYYQVEIQAINNQGKSLPKSFIFKTKVGVPEQVHVTSHHDSPNPTSYLLMWDKPDDGGSLLQKYIFRHREVEVFPDRLNYEVSCTKGEFTSVDIAPSDVSYRMSELMSGRYYQVEIQAVNIHGPSSPDPFIFKTKESVPQQVQITSHQDSPNSTSYLLTWNKPDDGGSQLLKYILKYQEVEIIPDRKEYALSRPSSEFISINISPSDVSFRLAPLIPGRYYQVEIKAINTQGQSTSQSFIFKTRESILKQEDKEVQTDFQSQVWKASDSTPAQVSGTNKTMHPGVLHPREKNVPTAAKITTYESSQWQLEKNKWQKQRVGKDKLDADEDSKQPLLETFGQMV